MPVFEMPNKTHSELIRELQSVVSALTERVDNLRADRERQEAALNRMNESLTALSNRVSVVETHVADLRKAMEEQARRWWSFLPAVVAALVGSLFTLLTQWLLSYLRK
jgi:hypothetical protein